MQVYDINMQSSIVWLVLLQKKKMCGFLCTMKSELKTEPTRQ
jgi:hypothetical protein